MSEQTHNSDPRILNRRSLERDHAVLASLLKPGMAVLDVGCGTGAITAGIARAVGPQGRVVGVDRDATLLELVQRHRQDLPNLRFLNGDALSLPFSGEFDIVTAARTLQRISQPASALEQMKKSARPRGLVVALDYNHAENTWEPSPPIEFQLFYGAFLDWRDAHGWDNRMAEHLPGLFRSVGLAEVESFASDEIAQRSDDHFEDASAVWLWVIESLGPQIAAEGFLSEDQRLAAEACYGGWRRDSLQKQTLSMQTVVGIVPPEMGTL
jgi:SAM-dependent methyltransferase